MPLGPLGLTGVLAVLDWGAWEWAISADHPTIGLIAGLLMAPIAVAFSWSFVRVVLALAQRGLRRAAAQAGAPRVAVTVAQRGLRRAGAQAGAPRSGRSAAPFDIESQDERVAA